MLKYPLCADVPEVVLIAVVTGVVSCTGEIQTTKKAKVKLLTKEGAGD